VSPFLLYSQHEAQVTRLPFFCAEAATHALHTNATTTTQQPASLIAKEAKPTSALRSHCRSRASRLLPANTFSSYKQPACQHAVHGAPLTASADTLFAVLLGIAVADSPTLLLAARAGAGVSVRIVPPRHSPFAPSADPSTPAGSVCLDVVAPCTVNRL